MQSLELPSRGERKITCHKQQQRKRRNQGALAGTAGEGSPTLELEAPKGLENKACSRGNSRHIHSGMDRNEANGAKGGGRGEDRETGSLCSVQATVRDF